LKKKTTDRFCNKIVNYPIHIRPTYYYVQCFPKIWSVELVESKQIVFF